MPEIIEEDLTNSQSLNEIIQILLKKDSELIVFLVLGDDGTSQQSFGEARILIERDYKPKANLLWLKNKDKIPQFLTIDPNYSAAAYAYSLKGNRTIAIALKGPDAFDISQVDYAILQAIQ